MSFFQASGISTSPSTINSVSLISTINPEIIFLIAAPILLVASSIIALYIARSFARGNSSYRTGKDRLITYRILIPKFKREEDSKAGVSQQQVQEKVAVAETFYSAIGGLKAQRGFKPWFYGRTDAIALEIVAHEGLITFYISMPKYLEEFVQQQLQAQYSDAQLDEVEDYNIFKQNSLVTGGYLKLKRASVVPIKTYKKIDTDPLNAITNAMSKVTNEEGLVLQFIVRSAKAEWRSLGRKLVTSMQKGESYEKALKGKSAWSSWFELFKSKESLDKDKQNLSEKRLTKSEEEMIQGIGEKMSRAGMDVNIRIISSTENLHRAEASMNQVLQSFSQYNIYEYGNAFEVYTPKKNTSLVRDFIYRRFNEDHSIVLNTEEMASLWHLPLPTTETPNIRWLSARTQPVPSQVMQNSGDLHLGFNIFRGRRSDIYTNNEDRARHMYVIGKTGSGKSYLLRYYALQDIANGHGICVVDPHGDLVDSILGSIPKERIEDVIYFSPADMERPYGMNMLEYDKNNPEQKTMVVNEMLAIFDQLYDLKATGGPMFEQYMRNAMLLVMDDPESGSTLLEISKVLSDEDFRRMKLSKCKNQVVIDFWTKEAEKAGGEASLANMVPYITSKMTAFISNDIMRPIITQQNSAFNFRQAMDSGKIILVNLSKGKLGEINAALIGMIVVGKLQVAAFSRTDIPESQRKDFFLYIDEFQNFITPSIASILSEARKYRLSLILAHQYMGQLVKNGKTEIRDAILGNVGSYLVARIGPEDVEVLAKIFEPTFSGYDLMNTDKFTWNAKIIVGNAQISPFTLKAVPPNTPNPELAEKLKQLSALKYGRERALVEKEILARSGM
jgi:hypothetical protein